MSKSRLWKTFLSVLTLVVLCDIMFGWGMNIYRKKYNLPGDYLRIEYLIKNANEDMILLSSSVGRNSFIPEIIEDSLSITCFNGGCNSQTTPFFLCMMDRILSRYTPKYFVLVFRPNELTGKDLERIDMLNPYYQKESKEMDYYIKEANGKASLFLISNLYKYNTIWWRILLTKFFRDKELSNKGFVSHSSPKIYPTFVDESDNILSEVNKERADSFIKMIEMCENAGVKLVVTIPPVYKKLPDSPNDMDVIEKICKENNVAFFNYSQDSSFVKAPELFHDNIHLLFSGAETITNIFIKDIVNEFGEN